jgi:hypothetical protein
MKASTPPEGHKEGWSVVAGKDRGYSTKYVVVLAHLFSYSINYCISYADNGVIMMPVAMHLHISSRRVDKMQVC